MTIDEDITPAFPEEAYQLGKKYQLGEPTDKYDTNFKLYIGCIAVVVALLVGPVILAGGLGSKQGIIAVSIVLVVFAIVLLVAFAQRKWRVYVYTNGFVTIKGRMIQPLRWDEIQLVRRLSCSTPNGYYTGTKSSMWSIRSKHDKILEFGNELYGIHELMKTIEAKVEKVESSSQK